MLSALLGNRAFLTVRQSVAQDRCGSLLALSDSHVSLTLIHAPDDIASFLRYPLVKFLTRGG
jgi:hypothetical protein